LPTHEESERFWRDWRRLTDEQRAAFKQKSLEFRDDVVTGHFRAGLRVKGFRGSRLVFEMTFAPNGRALWMRGEPRNAGDVHIVWLRIGGHEILQHP
jgi:hypothetical protein